MALQQMRPDVRVMDIDPNAMFQAFQNGESPVLFARRNPIPLRPAAQPAPPPRHPGPPQRAGAFAPPPPTKPQSGPKPWMLIVGGLVALPMFICCAGVFNGAFNSGNHESNDVKPQPEVKQEPAKSSTVPSAPVTSPSNSNNNAQSDDMSAYRQRFELVAKTFREQGAAVEEFDPHFPYTMRVTLPSRVAMDMTDGHAGVGWNGKVKAA